MKKTLVSIIVMSVVLSLSLTGVYGEVELKTYEVSEAVELARITDRQIVILVMSEGCTSCQEFKKKTLSDDRLRGFLNKHFIVSRLVLGSDSGKKKFKFPGGVDLGVQDMFDFLGMEYVPYSLFVYPDLSGRPLFFSGSMSPELYVKYLEYFSRWDRSSFSFVEYVKGISEKREGDFFNYRKNLKKISREEFSAIKDSKLGFKILESSEETKGLEGTGEVVLDFDSSKEAEELAEKILERGEVEKVYVVSSQK